MNLPFSFLPLNNGKCKFIDNVEKVLERDIQSPDQFGCKIINCHTHAGSKIHFKDFVEAELLFHNSYYNHGFAYLTVQEMLKHIDENIFDIVLIGYETYSELYLQEVKRQLEKYPNIKGKIYYCVYESFAKNENSVRTTSTRIRNLVYYPESPYFSVEYGFHEYPLLYAHCLKNPLCVFIVPINTTLTTMDKMMSKFRNELKDQFKKTKKDNNPSEEINKLLAQSLKLCLISIGPKSSGVNEYWIDADSSQQNSHKYSLLKPKEGKFTELNDKDKILSFAMIKSTWQSVHTKNGTDSTLCKDCFPDRLIDEKPIFDVTRGSVVPMLQLGKNLPGEPAKTFINDSSNLRRIVVLMNHMAHKHLSKGDDHFQYYFDTMGFLSDSRVISGEDTITGSVNEFLKKRVEDKEKCKDKIVFNYIIAPRHNINAKWVDIVNTAFINSDDEDVKKQFGTVRTLYFDITKEYRSNLQAKYSDFYRAIRNIIESEQYTSGDGTEIEIRFHFVDVTIASGQNILRAADLIRSLLPIDTIEKMSNKIRISLFDSIFLLYSRFSNDSGEFYSNLYRNIGKETNPANTANRLFSYVKINISHMRNHEDACTLCRLRNDYHHIQEECATNNLAQICDKVIKGHEVIMVSNIPQIAFASGEENKKDDIIFQANEEKQFLFLISHIINERLSTNRPLFENEKIKNLSVECQSKSSAETMETVLRDYYDNLIEYLNNSKQIDIEIKEHQKEYFKNAFIKAVSRPFFTFHLRKRQAAFSFCLMLLKKTINEFDVNSEDENAIWTLILTNTLVKALCDMNANYLIRSIPTDTKNPVSPFETLVKIAENGDKLYNKKGEEFKNKKNTIYERKDWFTTENYLHHIKKMLSLSQDKTKSVLLENILVNECEIWNFALEKSGQGVNSFLCEDGENDNIGKLSIKGKLYLENNKVVIEALNDLRKSNNVDKTFASYFFDNFKEIVSINQVNISAFSNFKKNYEKVLETIDTKNLSDKELSSMTNSISNQNPNLKNNWEITTFLRDTNVTNNEEDFNKIFEFLHFTSEPFSTYKSFYHDGNFEAIRAALKGNDNRDVLFVKTESEKCFVLLRFTNDYPISNDKSLSKDHSIYMQINNFDTSSPVDWFRLKILMTLRNRISKLISDKNIPEYIRQKHNEVVRLSLSLAKSVMHSAMEEEFTLKFANEEGAAIFYNDISDKNEIFQNIYYKHFTLLSDELIASWYRKIIRIYEEMDEETEKRLSEPNNELNYGFDKNGNIKDDDFHPFPPGEWCIDEFINAVKKLFIVKEKFDDDKIRQFKIIYNIYDADDHIYHPIDILLRFDKNSEKNMISFVEVDGSPELRNGLYLFLVIFIKNAYKHGKASEVNVIFDSNGKQIIISNQCKNSSLSTELDSLTRDLQDKIHTLPLACKGYVGENESSSEPSISLWTLFHLFKMQIDNESKIEIIPQYADGGDFQVVLKNVIK